jgi:hypothetical protein
MLDFLFYAVMISLAMPVISIIIGLIWCLGWLTFALGAIIWMKFSEIKNKMIEDHKKRMEKL